MRIRIRLTRLHFTRGTPTCCSSMNPRTAPKINVLTNVTMMLPQYLLLIALPRAGRYCPLRNDPAYIPLTITWSRILSPLPVARQPLSYYEYAARPVYPPGGWDQSRHAARP